MIKLTKIIKHSNYVINSRFVTWAYGKELLIGIFMLLAVSGERISATIADGSVSPRSIPTCSSYAGSDDSSSVVLSECALSTASTAMYTLKRLGEQYHQIISQLQSTLLKESELSLKRAEEVSEKCNKGLEELQALLEKVEANEPEKLKPNEPDTLGDLKRIIQGTRDLMLQACARWSGEVRCLRKMEEITEKAQQANETVQAAKEVLQEYQMSLEEVKKIFGNNAQRMAPYTKLISKYKIIWQTKVVCREVKDQITDKEMQAETDRAAEAATAVVQECNRALERLEQCKTELKKLEGQAINLQESLFVQAVQTELQQIFDDTLKKHRRWSEEMVSREKNRQSDKVLISGRVDSIKQ